MSIQTASRPWSSRTKMAAPPRHTTRAELPGSPTCILSDANSRSCIELGMQAAFSLNWGHFLAESDRQGERQKTWKGRTLKAPEYDG